MGAKLIKTKQELFVNYHLKNENGHTIATTLFPVPTEVEYAATSRGIKLQRISFKNCEAIERGYDLDELANELLYSKYPFHPSNDSGYWLDMYKEGFQKCLELMGDKKFSEDDVKNIFAKTLENAPSTESHTRMISDEQYRHSVMDELYDKITNSLQQTEWDVIVEMEDVMTFASMPKEGENRVYEQPKLDENGCLILKKI